MCVVVFYFSVMKSLSITVIRNWARRKGTWNLGALKNGCYGQFASSQNRRSSRQRLLQDSHLTEDEFGLFCAVYESSRTFVSSNAIVANNYWQYSSFLFLRFIFLKKESDGVASLLYPKGNIWEQNDVCGHYIPYPHI